VDTHLIAAMVNRSNLNDPDIEYLCVLRMYVTTDWFMISAMFNMLMRKSESDGVLMSMEDAKDTYEALKHSWPWDRRFRDAMHMRQDDPERLKDLLLRTGLDPLLPWVAMIDV
jgi:hypothetical protein